MIDIAQIIDRDIRSKYDLPDDAEVGYDEKTETWYYRVPADPNQEITINIISVKEQT